MFDNERLEVWNLFFLNTAFTSIQLIIEERVGTFFFSKKWPVYSYINGKLRLGVEFGFATLVVLLVFNSRTRSDRAQGHQARCHQARCKLVQEALQAWYQMCLVTGW